MKKLLTLLVVASTLLPATIYAKSSSHPKQGDRNENTGIITPDLAENMLRTKHFVQSEQGVLICRDIYSHESGVRTCTKNGKNAWRSMKNAVPFGKTYVGFKSVTGGQYGDHYIEIYWK